MKRYFLIALLFSLIIGKNYAQQYHSDKLKPVASFGKSMVIGLSVSSDNRVFVAFPKYNGKGQYTLTEVVNGDLKPYPDATWNEKGDYGQHFLRVQDLYVDAEDFLWVLDSKPASKGSIFGDKEQPNQGMFKLVKINTKTNEVAETYLFKDLDKTTSGLNDVRVDTEKQLAYLSDPGQAAIVVLDLKTRKTRSVLKGTAFTKADEDLVLDYDGNEMKDKNGKPFKSHVNGIALTKDFKYLYFKPINKLTLFRVETKYLADASLSQKELEDKVESVAKVGVTHGLASDEKGNIYLTTSTNYTISYVTPDGEQHTLVQDSRIIWPDSMGTGSDGYLYFTCAQLQRLPQWNNGKDMTEYPYTLFKVKLP